jgi:hypothetical protein
MSSRKTSKVLFQDYSLRFLYPFDCRQSQDIERRFLSSAPLHAALMLDVVAVVVLAEGG